MLCCRYREHLGLFSGEKRLWSEFFLLGGRVGVWEGKVGGRMTAGRVGREVRGGAYRSLCLLQGI